MPSFCRHNRFVQNCPICREPEPPASALRAPRRSSSSGAGTATRARSGARPPGAGGGRGGTGVRVRRVARAADDGFEHALVPGLRSSADALRLADELGRAAGRLVVLATAPPGAYAEAASAPDREEGLWLATLVAVLGPLESDDPWAGVRAAHRPWAGDDGRALDGVPLGPRAAAPTPAEATRLLAAYRAWAGRAGGQAAALAGDAGWSPERRFDRAFERLGTLPGFARGARYDLLATAGALGLADVRAAALHPADRDPTSLAARRVFGIADRFLLERRAAELAEAAGVPVAALDLALWNWSGEGARTGMGVGPDAADPQARDRVATALGLS